MKRGRPKGRSRDTRSFGPLGDLIRKSRLEKQLGLAEVAAACECSVQFISNIEHGRAPLPWDKVECLSSFLKIPVEQLHAANLAIRSDFKSFANIAGGLGSGAAARSGGSRSRSKALAPAALQGVTGAMAFTVKDPQLRELLERYRQASSASRKKFVKAALKMLPEAQL